MTNRIAASKKTEWLAKSSLSYPAVLWPKHTEKASAKTSTWLYSWTTTTQSQSAQVSVWGMVVVEGKGAILGSNHGFTGHQLCDCVQVAWPLCVLVSSYVVASTFQCRFEKTIQDGEKVGLQLWVCKTEFILVLLFINYCIIFHMNHCKLTFTPPSI